MTPQELAVLLVTSLLCGTIGFVLGYEFADSDHEMWRRDD